MLNSQSQQMHNAYYHQSTQPDKMSSWVEQKLKGAEAKLFASVCMQYIIAAEEASADTPEAIPIFSGLSANQRLQLVSEVAIGMLCEDEPFPPPTIQHKATYQALIRVLFMNIDLEEDTMDMDGFYEISEELLDFTKQEKEEWKYRNSGRATARGSTSMNNDMKYTLIGY